MQTLEQIEARLSDLNQEVSRLRAAKAIYCRNKQQVVAIKRMLLSGTAKLNETYLRGALADSQRLVAMIEQDFPPSK